MIKDTEIMKGNLFETAGSLLTVDGWDAKGIIINSFMGKAGLIGNSFINDNEATPINVYVSFNDAEPIVLTPGWLERLDYKKDLSDGKFYKQGSVLPPLYWINECRWGMSTLPVTGHYLQFVHQLQNLYFALTGEELTINEPA